MSLHISNLSSRVRINEIERVFRRFGHCNVNLKSGYGFVVYGVSAHAENALKVLRGTSICGETITISWSKQQPRSMHSLSRNNRLYELQSGSKSRPRSDISNMKVVYRGPRDRKNEYKDQDTNGAKTNHGNKTVSMTRYNEDNNKVTAGEDRGNLKEGCRKESENVRKNFKDNDRWEQGVDVLSSDINGEQERNRDSPNLDFADDKNVEENLPESHSGSSPSVIRSQNKIRSKLVKGAVDNLDKLNSQQSFNIHGQPGNKVQSCSGEKSSSQKKKLRKLDYEQDNEFEGDMKGLGSRSQEKLKFSRDVQMRHPQIDRKVSSSRSHHRLLKRVHSRIQEETQRRDWKKEYVERKHSKEDDWTPERQVKKVSGLVSSSVCSAHTASMSHSKSRFSSSAPRSDSVSRSRTKSLSSQAYSPSTKPEQKISGSGCKEARSRSSSPASSRSVFLGPALPSLPNESLNNTLINQDDNLKDVTCPDATDALVDQEEPVEEDAGLQSLKYEDMQMEKISEVESLKDSNDPQVDHIPQDENNNSAIDALLDQEEPVEADAGLQSLKYENMQIQKISEMEPLKDSNDAQEDHMNPQDENNNSAIDALLYLEELVEPDDGTQCLKHENMQMENISAVEPLKKSNDAQDHIPQDEDNNSLMENSSELQDDQYPDAPKTVKTFSPSERTDSKALMSGASRSCSTNPARISAEELCIVLKHYGLDVPAEDKKDLSVEAYFGSARLWPWQVIYYRRLKKGSISTENYARRVAQNQEFGIVDKYIRSSSGWGELGEED